MSSRLLYLGADSGAELIPSSALRTFWLENINPKPIYPESLHFPAGMLRESWKIVAIFLEGGGGALGLYDSGLPGGGLRFIRQKNPEKTMVWSPLKKMRIDVLNRTDMPARFMAAVACAERAPRVAS